MKKIILIALIIFAINIVYSQTYMKINQGTGSTLSPGNTVDEITFTPTFNCGDVILYGGESYPTVQIGTQCWMAKNLNVGAMITGQASDNNSIEKNCYYNLEVNCITYGGLYMWEEAMQYLTVEGTQGICPTGWHIPTYIEFQTLKTTVNDDSNILKSLAQGSGAGYGYNSTGFSALIAGIGYAGGPYFDIRVSTFFWGSSQDVPNSIQYMMLEENSNLINLFNWPYGINALSIRCIKD